MQLQAQRKVILTGTPIQNHLAELWNLFQFINPGLLGSAEQFKQKFILPIEGENDKNRQNQLRRLISPSCCGEQKQKSSTNYQLRMKLNYLWSCRLKRWLCMR